MNRIQQISLLGQAIWLDFISRDLLRSGQLADLVQEGLTGVTSNPTIFQKAISSGVLYDDDIRALAATGRKPLEIYEHLAIEDVGGAADVLRPVYERTQGRDGFVSIEVNPHKAHDTAATIEEARRLHAALGRPNVMIKVPATPAGLPAIEALIADGIHVNVTLIFALARYEEVMDAYIRGLLARRAAGLPVDRVASVASFFVSRVDTLTDKVLEHRMQHGEPHLEPLLGLAAVANAKLAYARYKAVFGGLRFEPLRAAGARPQRPLWASTSSKNPRYADTKYVDPLIGVNTVNTVPPQTLDAIRDHAVTAQTIEYELDQAQRVMQELAGIKCDMEWVTACLLEEGLKAFVDSFDQLLADISTKRDRLQAVV
ncbi:MAG: transaldolase [Phycisphaerales bacterium]|nr:transaldolase [Phycisphaerales bacterium]